MKMTLIEMVQSILSSLSSDEVNSYTDTAESLQVAEIIKATYFNIIARSKLTLADKMFQLTASTDPLLPILMYKPDGIGKLNWIKYYDTSEDVPSYEWIEILPLEDFLNMINTFGPPSSSVIQYTFTEGSSDFTFLYKNNKQPQFCTVLENYYILFDSFDLSVESTLQTSKTLCFGQTFPIFTMADTFTPVLDEYQFPLLLNEAKSLAFLELKQTSHSKADQESRRQWGNLQKSKSLTDKPSYFDQLANFGRGIRGMRLG